MVIGLIGIINHFNDLHIMKKIGEILLDTGVLLLGDMTNLKKMRQTPHHPLKQFTHAQSQKI